MDGWVEHRLQPEEREAFERDGFLPVEAALPADVVTTLRDAALAADRVFRAEPGRSPHAILNHHDVLRLDRSFLDLVDWPATFPKAFGVLGWNIQLFHTQLVVTPPAHPDAPPGPYGWHQDNNRMNRDFETSEHPRVSVKVAYFLSDLPHDGMGNLCVRPGSHRRPPGAAGDDGDEGEVREVTARAGDALLFDRRLWHSASANHAATTRIALFYGYSYRWLRPKSTLAPVDPAGALDPVRRQLLGAATSPNGRFDPQPDDVPLRAWIEDHLGAEAVMP